MHAKSGRSAPPSQRSPVPSAPARLQVVVFPGNPGSAAYFKPLMREVHERLRGQADVLAVTHAGHDMETDHGGRVGG